jgi:SAM-dependent methyltransferase
MPPSTGKRQGPSAGELAQKLKSGELDLAELLAAPEPDPRWSAVAERMTLESLLATDPATSPESLGDAAWGMLGASPDTRLEALDADQRAWISDLLSFWRRRPVEISDEISPDDGMYAGTTPQRYFGVGKLTVRLVRLAMLETRRGAFRSILDFACGYGRILRTLKAAFPEAELTACDINRDAVDFCARAFGATPIYSEEDPQKVALDGEFDLIWVGSLFTHLSGHRWTEFLDLLEPVLVPDGLLLFTTNGRNVQVELASGAVRWKLSDEGLAEVLRGYEEDGFGYSDWAGAVDYGSSLSRPSWVCAQIERRPGLRLVSYREKAWGRQDIVVCAGAR